MQVRSSLLTAVLMGAASLIGCTYKDATNCQGLEVSHAWVREAPPASGVQAGYFDAFNSSGDQIIVHSVQSPYFARVEMHETVNNNGGTSMQKLDTLEMPPRTSSTFEAGGKHLMLFQPRLPYEAGDRVELEFICGTDRDSTLVNAEIRSAKPAQENAPVPKS